MGIVSSRFSTTTALIAALSMAATPTMAAPLSAPVAAAGSVKQLPGARGWQVENETVNRQRWDDRRGGGYGRSYRRHHRGGIDAGDVIAGVLVIGGIAAIASAASNSSRDKRARDDEYRSRDYPYADGPSDYRGSSDDRYSDSRGINHAVNNCVREAGRDGQVGEVESAQRTDDGWRIEGSLRGGRDFSCATDNDGRVRNVDTDRSRASTDRQWNDERYARARDAQERRPDSGDEYGRYGAGDVPDFDGGV